jgi:hypothetical protein
MRLSRLVLAALAVSLTVVPALGVASPNGAAGRTFYLDLRPGQCAVYPPQSKYLQVVPCSNGAHNLEAYGVGHGGWGHGHIPAHATALAVMRSLCTNLFQRRFGHRLGSGYGYYGLWPDAGKEETKYGDRMICSVSRYPAFLSPLGPGVHH